MSPARWLLALVVIIAVACTTGCAPRIHVVSQLAPNPIVKTSSFKVEELVFEDLHIGAKTDTEYVGSFKKGTTPEQWSDDKGAIVSAFAVGFSDEQDEIIAKDGGEFVVKATCKFIEPGWFAGISNGAARVKVHVKILRQGGELVDEIEIEGQAVTADKRTRLRAAGYEAGTFLAKYLKKRAKQHV